MANAEVLEASAFGILKGYDIVIVGELHDNAAHHANQARIAQVIGPKALVFEMLSAEQAEAGQDAARDDPSILAAALGWSDAAWPNFSDYYPIFAAAPEAVIYGAAVPRDRIVGAMTQGAATPFDGATTYGLDAALGPDEQEAREVLQAEAHCNALPAEMLPQMVEAQRLRDASFARVAVQALEETGGPVLVITGNGHARTDWGMPRYIARGAPDVRSVSVGQVPGAEGELPYDFWPYDFWIVTGSYTPENGDPCAAFTKSN